MTRNRVIILSLIGGGSLAAAALIWWGGVAPALAGARIASGQMAKSVCSCLYVDGLDLERCRADAAVGLAQRPGAIRLNVDAAARTVSASLFLRAAATAAYEEGYGCTLK